jgi:putative FmdB family regulatory protein
MPTYDYECSKCGSFEAFHSMSGSLDKCPTCGKPVRRLISWNSNVIFKGSGFHTTDNRSSEYRKQSTSENAGASTTPKTDTPKTDTPKTESKAS